MASVMKSFVSQNWTRRPDLESWIGYLCFICAYVLKKCINLILSLFIYELIVGQTKLFSLGIAILDKESHVLLCLKIDLASLPTRGEEVGKYILI